MKQPARFLEFNGLDNWVEVPDLADYSVATTGRLTVAAWMRPDALVFPQTEGTRYVYWLGKGERGAQEWVFRMYSQDNTEGRHNRISFYVFNPGGGYGVGSYDERSVEAGQWLHVAGTVDGTSITIHVNGESGRGQVYAGEISPAHTSAPLRMATRDFRSYFQGALAQVRIWNRVLSATELRDLAAPVRVPETGLVGHWPLDEGDGDVAGDSVAHHDGTIFGARWATATNGRSLLTAVRGESY